MSLVAFVPRCVAHQPASDSFSLQLTVLGECSQGLRLSDLWAFLGTPITPLYETTIQPLYETTIHEERWRND
ncbi:hypothetical protein PSTG_19338 [Puccinia striiformis f. sp. tritici PST-78]|uniref:Uncharacterized protein n=1 Tax=Puccinia striiformis f. sp. tritici PST-78 TaxID=1165861 RepID=A0A0L0UJT3_9BASI|nr:hypothetical protein PSTG_19338 [Puccinia striiformis f. sp. tritici PST-78]